MMYTRMLVLLPAAAMTALGIVPASAAAPPLSEGCAEIHAGEPVPIAAEGQIVLTGTFAAGEQVRITPTTSAGVSVASGGGGGGFEIVDAGADFRYDVTSAGARQIIIGALGGGETTASIACGVPPTATITSPSGTYTAGWLVPAAFDCAAGTNEVATCEGGDPDQSAGGHTYAVTATDTAGLRSVTTSSYTVNKKSQTLTFATDPPVGATWGHFPYFVEATSTSGLPVTIAVDEASTGCAGPGGVADPFVAVSLLKPGTCIIHADQSGTDEYEAADRITQTFEIGKLGTYLTTVKASKGLLGLTPTTFRAELDADIPFGPGIARGGYVGKQVTFSIAGKPMCTATTVAVPGDNIFFPDAVATCKATIGLGNALKNSYTASFGGDAYYKPSSAVGKLQ